jgi:hypothetical protein
MMSTILLVAICAAIWQKKNAFRESRLSPVGALSTLLPAEFNGVSVQDLPLGPNEYVDGVAKEKMDYDDVIYRSYTTPHGSFSVYIGYWARGKRSPSHIAAHTPDRCWTLAGMTCLESKADYQVKGADSGLAQGHWRRFRTQGAGEIETVFWHVVGDGFYDYGRRLHDYTPPMKRVSAVISELFSRKNDQYFIRISSEKSLDDFSRDPAFIAVMAKVSQLGLRKD